MGVIGAGAIARMVHLPVLTAMPDVRVAFLADADGARAAALARACGVPHREVNDLGSAVEDCDAVLLAIPVGARTSYLELLSRAGVAALVEKPFARTLDEHRRALDLFPAHALACGFMRRTYASSLLARRILGEGWLGPPRGIRVSEGGRTTKTGVNASHVDQSASAGGGVLLDLGCHALDLVFHLTGAQGHRVLRQEMVRDGKVDRRAEGEVVLDLGKGAPLPLHYVFSWLDRQEDVLEIEFATARLRLSARPERPPALLGLGKDTKEVHLHADDGGATTSNQAFYLEWRWVLDGLRSGTPSPLAAASCLPVTALLEELYR